MLVVSLCLVPRRGLPLGRSHLGLLFVVVLVAHGLLFIEAGGRLMVAGVGISLVAAIATTRPRRQLKVLVLLVLPVFLLLAVDRFGLGTASGDRTAALRSGGGSLASVYDPADVFAEIVELDIQHPTANPFGRRYGGTFLASGLAWVPRAFWAEKPVLFGLDLTAGLRPEALPWGHSMAGLIHSEWYVNFGFAGIAVMPFVLALFLARLDRRWTRAGAAADYAHGDPLMFAARLCVISSVADLFWVGSSLFVARGVLAAVFLIICRRMFAGLFGVKLHPTKPLRSYRHANSSVSAA
jgi:hypothetical protein